MNRIRKKKNTKTGEYKTSTEVVYYLSTKKLSAKEFYQVIRNHWKIENKLHYVKDVIFNEDKSRRRKNPGVFSRCIDFAINIFKANKVNNIKESRERCAYNLDKTISYIANI